MVNAIELRCGPKRLRTAAGMTNLERICAIGWEVDENGSDRG